jgi:hypothetical protein
MDLSAEWLAEIDAELEALGRSPDEIEAVLGRFEDHAPEDLEAVDAQLEDLAAGVSIELPEPAPKRERKSKRERKRERARAHEHEPATEEPIHVAGAVDVGVDADPDDMPTVESADRATGRLSEEDLFGDTPSDEPPAPEPAEAARDYSYLFGPDSDLPPPGEEEPAGDALLDSLERDIESFAPTASDDADGDPTHVFSSNDLAAIERDALASSPPPRSARPPSQNPPSRDPDFDALLGDDESVFRPSQHPPAGGADAVDDDAGDFELLVDEDLLVEVDEDPLDDLPSVEATLSQRPPPPPAAAMSRPPPSPSVPAAAASQTSPPPEGETDEGSGQKKGFFKKLFGGKE